eukprot:1785175-Rhodomonas_salina.3
MADSNASNRIRGRMFTFKCCVWACASRCLLLKPAHLHPIRLGRSRGAWRGSTSGAGPQVMIFQCIDLRDDHVTSTQIVFLATYHTRKLVALVSLLAGTCPL